MHNYHYLEDASTCTTTTEASTCVSDTVDMTSESVESHDVTILDEDSVIDEILIGSNTDYKSKKKSSTANNLSKLWKISQETAQRTIDDNTQRCVRQSRH